MSLCRTLLLFSLKADGNFPVLSPHPSWPNLKLHCLCELCFLHPGDSLVSNPIKLVHHQGHFSRVEASPTSPHTTKDSFSSKQLASTRAMGGNFSGQQRDPAHTIIIPGQSSGVSRLKAQCALSLLLSSSRASTGAKTESALSL